MTTCDADRLFIKHQKNQLVLHCTGTDTDDLNVNKIRLELTRTIPTLTLFVYRSVDTVGCETIRYIYSNI